MATSAVVPWLARCAPSTSSDDGQRGEDGDRRGAATATGGPSTRGMLAERPFPPEREPTLRVRIDRVRADGTLPPGPPTEVTAPDGQILLRALDRSHRGVLMRTPARLRFTAAGWSIIDADGFRPPISPTAPIALTTPNGHAALLTWKGRPYPGHLRLWPRTDIAPGAVDVVSHVPIEQYLPGVLAGELYRHWRLETFIAQAIAARSFACFEFMDVAAGSSRGERRHYDLTNTSASQVYIGSGAYPRALEAVKATRGVVLVYDGRLVPGFYSSCCGGLPARAIDAVSSNPVVDIEPLNGAGECTTCRDANVYRWTRRMPISAIVQRLRAWGTANGNDDLADLSDLRAIEVSAVNQHGRPTQYAVRGRAHTIEIGAERLRRALSLTHDADETISEDSTRYRPLRSSMLTATLHDGVVDISGRGFGHGVGMCQHGAEGRAQRGDDAATILSWYYPASSLERAYA